MNSKEYTSYESFIDGVADDVYQNEIGQHCLLENFNFGVERKHIAETRGTDVYYQVYEKQPFNAWVEVTEDYEEDFENEIDNKVMQLVKVEDEDPRDCIGYDKESYLM